MRNQIKRLILTINLVAFGFSSLSAAIEAPVNCSASFNFEKDSQFSENEMKLSAEAEFRETIVDRFEGRGKDLKIATKEMEIQNKLLSTDELHLTGSVLRLKDAIHQSFREIERDLTANSSNLRISFQNIRKQKMID